LHLPFIPYRAREYKPVLAPRCHRTPPPAYGHVPVFANGTCATLKLRGHRVEITGARGLNDRRGAIRQSMALEQFRERWTTAKCELAHVSSICAITFVAALHRDPQSLCDWKSGHVGKMKEYLN